MFGWGLKDKYKKCCYNCKHRKVKLTIDIDSEYCEELRETILYTKKRVCDKFEPKEKEKTKKELYNFRRV